MGTSNEPKNENEDEREFLEKLRIIRLRSNIKTLAVWVMILGSAFLVVSHWGTSSPILAAFALLAAAEYRISIAENRVGMLQRHLSQQKYPVVFPNPSLRDARLIQKAGFKHSLWTWRKRQVFARWVPWTAMAFGIICTAPALKEGVGPYALAIPILSAWGGFLVYRAVEVRTLAALIKGIMSKDQVLFSHLEVLYPNLWHHFTMPVEAHGGDDEKPL